MARKSKTTITFNLTITQPPKFNQPQVREFIKKAFDGLTRDYLNSDPNILEADLPQFISASVIKVETNYQ